MENEASSVDWDNFLPGELIQHGVNLYEDLLKKVVQMALGREDFELDEVKRFSFMKFEHLMQREFIGLDGQVIGEVTIFQKQENLTWKIGFEFMPGEMIIQKGELLFASKPDKK